MRGLLAVWRILCGVVHLLHGVLICAFVFPFVRPQQQAQRVGSWSARMLHVLGVSLRVDGTPRGGATLVVANHISWLDILAINAACPVRFVSKADVRRWPVIGWLVAAAGTLFIERERKRDALRVVHQVAQALKQGHTVALFPEGTTTDGHELLPFHANLFQAAISTGTPVQPVALRFSDARDAVSAAAAYVGDMNLLQSLWAIATARQLCAHVTWLGAEATEHADRRALAEHMRRQIDLALNVKDWRSAAG